MREQCSDYVLVLKAMADETRLHIIEMLSCEELCACKILENLDITQPTLSYHMKILSKCGLVSARKEGIWMNYKLNEEKVLAYKQFMNELFNCCNE